MLPQLQLVAGGVERERERESERARKRESKEGDGEGAGGEGGGVRRESKEGEGERGRENQISDRCLHRTSNTFPSVKVDEQRDLGISLSTTMCALCLNCVADSH